MKDGSALARPLVAVVTPVYKGGAFRVFSSIVFIEFVQGFPKTSDILGDALLGVFVALCVERFPRKSLLKQSSGYSFPVRLVCRRPIRVAF
jgi:hypothetical protein